MFELVLKIDLSPCSPTFNIVAPIPWARKFFINIFILIALKNQVYRVVLLGQDTWLPWISKFHFEITQSILNGVYIIPGN